MTAAQFKNYIENSLDFRQAVYAVNPDLVLNLKKFIDPLLRQELLRTIQAEASPSLAAACRKIGIKPHDYYIYARGNLSFKTEVDKMLAEQRPPENLLSETKTQETFLELLAAGKSLKNILEITGVSKEDYYRHRQQNPDFVKRIDAIKEKKIRFNNPQFRAHFLEQITKTKNISQTCVTIGVSPSEYYSYISRNPQFKIEVQKILPVKASLKNPEVRQQLLSQLAINNIPESLAAIGLSRSTFYGYLRKNPQFKKLVYEVMSQPTKLAT